VGKGEISVVGRHIGAVAVTASASVPKIQAAALRPTCALKTSIPLRKRKMNGRYQRWMLVPLISAGTQPLRVSRNAPPRDTFSPP